MQAKCAGWTVAMYSADARLEKATRLPLRPVLGTVNGGIPVRVVTTVITATRKEE